MPHTGLIVKSGDEPLYVIVLGYGFSFRWTFADKTTQYLDDLRQHCSIDSVCNIFLQISV